MPINPVVSVVLPVYNGLPFLGEALESLWQQTFTHFEVIVVDDGSTDGTLDYLRACQDPRLRVIAREHEGIVAALNAGIKLAKAPLIARMDSDDRCHRDRFRRQVEALDQQPELGLIATGARYWGDEVKGAGFQHFVTWNNRLLDPETIYLRRFVESPVIHPTVMFRRNLIARLGGYREGDFPEDYELWLRWLSAGVRMAKLDWLGVDWRERPRRLSRADDRYSVSAFYRLKAHYIAQWLKSRSGVSESVLIWGAGRTTRQRVEWLVQEGIAIRAYIDIDPRKIGQVIHGRPVIDVNELPPPGKSFLLSYVGSRGARARITEHLQAKGYREGRDFLLVA